MTNLTRLCVVVVEVEVLIRIAQFGTKQADGPRDLYPQHEQRQCGKRAIDGVITGKKPLTAMELREETTIPIRFVNDLLFDLMNAGLIVEITSDEKGETSRFMPAEDIHNLTLGTMIDRLESAGQWKIDLNVSDLFSDEWAKAIELRGSYLREARKIALKDL